MALIDDAKQICDRLVPLGWGALLQWHGLNIAAADLAGELQRPLTGIRCEIAGFADFHGDTTRGVEPGGPRAVCSTTRWQVRRCIRPSAGRPPQPRTSTPPDRN
jgi:hypothetical protein